MTRAYLSQVVIAFVMGSAHDLLHASSITVGNISGDTHFLHLELNMIWSAAEVAGPPSQVLIDSANGAWTGGNWQFTYGVAETHFNPDVPEGSCQFELQTVWDDGWTPFPVLSTHFFIFGNSFHPSYFMPIVDRPVTDNGITYLYSANHTGTMATFVDTSGNAQIVFDLSRAAVPEASTLALFGMGLSLFALSRLRHFRRRTRSKT